MFEDEKPREVEAEGKTVDEAVRKALIMTGWTREQVAVEVLDQAGHGTWVAGSLARVRVSRSTGDALELARRVTADILERMGLPGRVQSELRPEHIHVVIQGEGLEEKLVGGDGEGLDALQHLAARIVSKQSGSRQMLNVDLGGYRQRRERELRDLAYELADAVRQTGHPVVTEPMGAGDRRVVHLALNEDPDITTFAVGDGLVKPITIAPIDQALPPQDRRSTGRGSGEGRVDRGGREERWSGPGGGRRGPPRSDRRRGPPPGREGDRGGSRSGGRGGYREDRPREGGPERERDRHGAPDRQDDRDLRGDRDRQGDRDLRDDRDPQGDRGRSERRSEAYEPPRDGEWPGGGSRR